jgi:hypothetical protein
MHANQAWLFDNKGSRVDYKAPGAYCTWMAYSADGKRLFSCGVSATKGLSALFILCLECSLSRQLEL